jgi:hypothetical protein
MLLECVTPVTRLPGLSCYSSTWLVQWIYIQWRLRCSDWPLPEHRIIQHNAPAPDSRMHWIFKQALRHRSQAVRHDSWRNRQQGSRMKNTSVPRSYVSIIGTYELFPSLYATLSSDHHRVDVTGSCLMRSLVICIAHQMFFGWSRHGKWDL